MTFDIAAYDRHMMLAKAHEIVAKSIMSPESVDPQILRRQKEYIAACDILARKPDPEINARDAEFRAQIMADPRFAAWVAGQKS